MIVFISGGARSGKSRFAEETATEFFRKQGTGRLVYIATALRTDAEMEERIRGHVLQRSKEWHTVEAPLELGDALESTCAGDVVLVDCLTVWLNNRLFMDVDGESTWGETVKVIERCITAAARKNVDVIFVSNDVNEGMPVKDNYVTDYIKKLEEIHKLVIAGSDAVYQVVAGLAVQWKGAGG